MADGITPPASGDDDFPARNARTRRFTLGEPRSVTVAAGGDRVFFLRSVSGTDPRTGLWWLDVTTGAERPVVDPEQLAADADLPAEERARRERVRETAAGVVAYAVSDDGSRAVFTLDGTLHAADVARAEWRALPAAAGAFDPRIDPFGTTVAYVAGRALRLHEIDSGLDRELAADDDDTVSWGRAEHVAAEEMDRFRGFWWAPDATSVLAARVDEAPIPQWWIADPAHPDRPPTPMRYPVAGSADADVSLHVLSVADGSRVEVSWDRAAFPYLARVHWSAAGPPLVQVISRDQRTAQVRSIDVLTGGTELLAEDTDPVWVEPFAGVPGWAGDQLVRIVDSDDARQLVVGPQPMTDPSLRVRSVVAAEAAGVVFTASTDDPTQTHVFRWSAAGGTVERLTDAPGVHGAAGTLRTLLVTSSSLEQTRAEHVVHTEGGGRFGVRSDVLAAAVTPQVQLLRLGGDQLASGLVLPRGHQAGTPLPVLLAPYAGPHAQRVVASQRAWLEAQWFADQGFAVLVVDGRGTPGRGPQFERAISRDLAIVLEDQVQALHAAARVHPDLDLNRVGIRGWSFGGYLAALAVLRRPDVFHAAVAGAPVTEWALYDTFYTERYLGRPQDDREAYARASLLDDAPRLTRPLLIIHGLADDNVVAAHSLLFSQRLTEAGRPHSLLPLTGVTHMTPQESVAENLLRLQVEFLRRELSA